MAPQDPPKPPEDPDEFHLTAAQEEFLDEHGEHKDVDFPVAGTPLAEVPGYVETVHNINTGNQWLRRRDRESAEAKGRVLKGCLPAALAGVIGVIVVLLVLEGAGPFQKDANELTETPSATPTPTATESPAESPSASGNLAPPAAGDLPPGAILFQGNSGGPIGCIACDGQSRFLSLKKDGVVVGNAGIASVSTPWTMNGKITSFGARLSGPNKGRYGVNIFFDGARYGPGVALEVGQQSALYQWSPERDGTIKAGQQATIIVGEAGTLTADKKDVAAKGEATLTWWFVFQPD